jgi:hypothetical protein
MEFGASIGFSATIAMSGAPKEMERIRSADQATSHERRVSIVPVAVPPRAAITVAIYDPMARARLCLAPPPCSQSKRRANAASASVTTR